MSDRLFSANYCAKNPLFSRMCAMKFSMLRLALLSSLCMGCQTVHAPAQQEDIVVETGAVMESSRSVSSRISAESSISEQSSEMMKEERSQAEVLRLSYEDAIAVRDVVVDLMKNMDSDARASLQDAIDVFSQDIDALKYYVELAEREPLLDEDHRSVAVLSANIEEAIATFAAIVELLM